MNSINIRKFGLATGLTMVLFYLGCILLMIILGSKGTVQLFNSLLHGLDVSSIVRMNVPFWEAVIGLIETFVLGWLLGVCIAGIYNFNMVKRK